MATLVTNQLAKNEANEDFVKWKNEQRHQPTLPNAHVEKANTVPPIPFDSQVFQNDMNDSFDHKCLLNIVPKKFRNNAKSLIAAFDASANDFTWDSSGQIYIDENSIPGANMFEIFPKLFSKRPSKRIRGFQDVVQKIKAMGLSHLILMSNTESDSNTIGEGSLSSQKQDKSALQWWYIGD